MLSLKVMHHENVATGSFPIAIHFDLVDEYFHRSGWDGYVHASKHMADWCRERWGETPGYSLGLAQWMCVGKRFFVRTDEQAMELVMRWHGAEP